MGDNKISEAVDRLAQVIREVDGNHSLGAGALAEAIIAKLPHLQGEAVPVAGKFDQSAEDRYEQFVQAEIARSPDALRELGEYLGRILDEDDFPKANALLLQLATEYPPQPAELSEVSGDVVELCGRTYLRSDVEAALAATGKQKVGEVQGDALLESLVNRWRKDADEVGTYDNTLCQKIANCTMRHAAELQAVIAARQPAGQEAVVTYCGRRLTPEGTRECWGVLAEGVEDLPRNTKLYAALPAQAVDLSPIATRKLGELAVQGYITNGVAIFNPATGHRGLVDNLGFVGWVGAQGIELGQLPAGWSLRTLATCYQLSEGNQVVANLVGPDSERNAQILATLIEQRDAAAGVDTLVTDAMVEAAADAIISDGYPFELGLEHARAALEAAFEARQSTNPRSERA